MLPRDPMILLSYVNTLLRDQYESLAELCRSLDVDEESLKKKLSDAGFVYREEQNQFQ